jgi:hypothetical protein
MRRQFGAALLGIAVLAATNTDAQATPKLHLAVHALRVVGFPHTGNVANAPATLSFGLAIEGEEYGGHPAPLTGLTLGLPRGMRWVPGGFKRCEPFSMNRTAPWGCPRGAEVEAAGDASLYVAFGSEIVQEQATIKSYYNGAEAISLEPFGRTPVLLEIFGRGTVSSGRSGHGPQFRFTLPLVETVPGASFASFTSLDLMLGSADRSVEDPGKPHFSLHMPSRCRPRQMLFIAEASFSAVGGLPAQTARASYRAPCPRGSHRKGAAH